MMLPTVVTGKNMKFLNVIEPIFVLWFSRVRVLHEIEFSLCSRRHIIQYADMLSDRRDMRHLVNEVHALSSSTHKLIFLLLSMAQQNRIYLLIKITFI